MKIPGPLAAAALVVMSGVAHAQIALTFRGTRTLPATFTPPGGSAITITGLSSLGWDDSRGVWVALQDNGGRLVDLSLSFGPDGAIPSAGFLATRVLSVTTLDTEGIALDPGAPGWAWVSEENTPSVRRFNVVTGAAGPTIAPPTVFSSGLRSNFGFEALTRDAATGTLWTGNEEALTADGPISTPSAGTVVRLLELEPNGSGGFVPGAQYAYVTEPIHGSTITGARSGLVELLVLPGGTLLSVERSLALSGLGFFRTRIFEVSLSGATDVSGRSGLSGGGYVPVGKRLLWAGDATNMEGLALGPTTGPGRAALVGIVDDGDPISVNQVVAFEVSGLPVECPCPADYDGSGSSIADIEDLVAFFGDFGLGAARADVTCTGAGSVPDIEDVLRFMEVFVAGGC